MFAGVLALAIGIMVFVYTRRHHMDTQKMFDIECIAGVLGLFALAGFVFKMYVYSRISRRIAAYEEI
jgi:hypothetical protein